MKKENNLLFIGIGLIIISFLIVKLIPILCSLCCIAGIVLIVIYAKNRKNNSNQVQNMQQTTPNIIQSPPIVQISSQPHSINIPQQLNNLPLAYRYENVDIAIIKNAEPNFNDISIENPVQLIPEKTNPYDSNAIMVVSNGVKLGYLYKGTLQDMANDFIKKELPIFSYISEINPNENKIKIFLAFYKQKALKNEDVSEYEKLKNSGTPFKTFKLTGNANSEMQDTISYSSVGDEVEFEFDYEKEKYAAVSGSEIGYMPKSKTEFLDNDEDYHAFIEEIDEDENGKYTVSVSVF